MIKEFHIEDAQKLADMFNASDEGWPGGFAHGLDMTPELVLENMKRMRAITTYVAWERDKIVGIAELTEFWEDTNTSYIGLLNVVPIHHGRGYGRDLLKACVQKVAELKYKRLDLHTWTGNMKAVPLYKKTGFFWVPKTTVHMKNFLPLILNLGAARPYFENHDWYKTFKRDLKVEEDDFDGVYPHHWEEDGDMLSVVIDAESGGVTSFENNDFFVSQDVGDAFAGHPVKVAWVVKNKTKRLLNVTLLSRGDTGITMEKKESFTIGKEEVKITGEAFIDPDIETRKKEEPPHLLITDVVIDGMTLSLHSGLRVNQPIEVSSDPEYLILPEGKREILVLLKNNQKVKAEGTITCQNTGESHPFVVGPELTEGTSFSVEVEDGELRFVIEGHKKVYIMPVQVMKGANVMQKGKEVVLENAHARIVVQLRGGITTIFDKNTKDTWITRTRDQLGPPFWPSEFSTSMYTARIENSTAEFTVESKRYGVKLTRRMEMDSSPVVTVCHTILPQEGVSLHFCGSTFLSGGLITVPLKEGIVQEPPVEDDFPLGHGDFPRDPSAYAEQWMCYEKNGSAFGFIWEDCQRVTVEEDGFLDATMDTHQVKPVYLYMGRGTWEDVRAAWARIHGKDIQDVTPVGVWDVTPSVILCANDTVTQEMTLKSYRGRPLTGKIDGHPFTVKKGNPFTFTRKFSKLTMGVTTKHLDMETDLFTERVPVSVVQVGKKGDINIDEKDIITIDNGLYTLKVAPHFYGSVIFFGKECNHLLTPYPETTQFSWLKPWYGGIHPALFTEYRYFPGRTYRETFTHQVVSTEKAGIPWKGVKIMCTSTEIKGIQLNVSYLTTAHSNMLAIENTVKNLTSAPIKLYSGIFFFVQPDGSYKKSTLYYEQHKPYERKRTPFGGWVQCNDWAAIKGEKTYLTVVTESMEAMDLGNEGAHTYAVKKVELNPRGELTCMTFFAAADSLDHARQYKKLRRVTWT